MKAYGLFFAFSLIVLTVHGQEKQIASKTLTTTYERDSLGRPIRVHYSNGMSLGYAFDGNGNRIRQASSVLIFAQGVAWQGETINMVVKIKGETDDRAIERLEFTTGRTYKAAPYKAVGFMLNDLECKGVIEAYLDTIKDGEGIPLLNTVGVVLVPNKPAKK